MEDFYQCNIKNLHYKNKGIINKWRTLLKIVDNYDGAYLVKEWLGEDREGKVAQVVKYALFTAPS